MIAAGEPGHFALVGMQERARKIGAHLKIVSCSEKEQQLHFRSPVQWLPRSIFESSLWRWTSSAIQTRLLPGS
jgi:hypothetical protein